MQARDGYLSVTPARKDKNSLACIQNVLFWDNGWGAYGVLIIEFLPIRSEVIFTGLDRSFREKDNDVL